jgi:NAD-dependent deacetylase
LDPFVTKQVEQVLEEPFDVALVVGTSATFDYIREWAHKARARGALLVEVNPRVTVLTPHVDARITGNAGEVLHDLLP